MDEPANPEVDAPRAGFVGGEDSRSAERFRLQVAQWPCASSPTLGNALPHVGYSALHRAVRGHHPGPGAEVLALSRPGEREREAGPVTFPAGESRLVGRNAARIACCHESGT